MNRTNADGSGQDEGQDPWLGVEIAVGRYESLEGAYRVEFIPGRMASPRGPDGEFPSVPDNARVVVRPDPELRVIFYDPPEDPLPHLAREDYEAKALDEVRRAIERGR